MQNAALVGFGYWGPNIAKNLNLSKDFNLYAICDIDPKQLEKAHNRYGDGVKYTPDYKDLLADPNIEMIAVSLREDAQMVARDVLRSGRHLFMEKPMATSVADGELLKKLAEENGVLIHVDHIMVHHPVIQKIKSIIDSGELGDLVYFESNRTNLGPHIKRNMNVMWDLAVHDLAVLDFLCGGQPVRDIYCMGAKRFGNQELVTFLNLKYDNFIAMIKSSWFSPIKDRTVVLSGTNKMIVFDDVKESEKLMIYDKGVVKDEFHEYGTYEAKVRSGDLCSPNIPFEDSLQNGLKHFAVCIRENKESISGPDQALRTLHILEQADALLKK